MCAITVFAFQQVFLGVMVGMSNVQLSGGQTAKHHSSWLPNNTSTQSCNAVLHVHVNLYQSALSDGEDRLLQDVYLLCIVLPKQACRYCLLCCIELQDLTGMRGLPFSSHVCERL